MFHTNYSRISGFLQKPTSTPLTITQNTDLLEIRIMRILERKGATDINSVFQQASQELRTKTIDQAQRDGIVEKLLKYDMIKLHSPSEIALTDLAKRACRFFWTHL